MGTEALRIIVTGRTSVHGRLEQSLTRAVSWVQAHRYRGYEPADGNSSYLFPLTRGRVFPMRVLQQVVLRAPFNIRPVLGVSPHESAIGRGYMAWAYARLYRLKGDRRLRDELVDCLEWLIANRAPRCREFCWGDPYDYATRAGRRPYGEPLLIWSAQIGRAFLDAYELLQDERYLHVAASVGDWILNLPREHTETGSCLSYVAYRQSSIHNANVVGAAFLAQLWAAGGKQETLTVANSAMRYTCARQQADGSWFYAEDQKYHWIDSFHTGYNISALQQYRVSAGDSSFDDCLDKGLRFYKGHFFEPDARPKYFHDKVLPIDIQCASQAIETLAALSEDDQECLPLAIRVANWTIENMQSPDGHFYYRDLGWTKVRTPMLHWGQATMVKALAVLLEALAVAPGATSRPAASPVQFQIQ